MLQLIVSYVTHICMWLQDISTAGVRAAWRRARAQPVAALAMVATVAVAVGAATAVYALVREVVLRPLPVQAPDRLVWMWNARVERDRAPFSIPDLEDYRAGGEKVVRLAPFTNWTANLTGAGDAEGLEGVRVGAAFFDVIGVVAAHGRLLTSDDDQVQRVTVLTDRLWRRRFAADPAVVGRSVQLNGSSYVVAGILPPGFLFPFRDAELAVPLPWSSDARRADRGANFLRVVARLNPGVSLEQADETLDQIGRRLQREFPGDDAKKLGVLLVPLGREITGDARPLLLTLLAAVGAWLLIGCANLVNILLVTTLARRRELAVRLALGASPRRLTAELMGETAAMVAVGGVLGAATAVWMIRGLVWWAGKSLPRLDHVALSTDVLGMSLATTIGCALTCAFIAARVASRHLDHELMSNGRAPTGNLRQRRVAHAFVIVQVAASLVLLATVFATVRSFRALERAQPGFAAENALTVQLSMPPARYGTPADLMTFAERLRPRLESIGGVDRVAAISLMPLSGLLSTVDFRIVGRDVPTPDQVPQGHFRIATRGYFEAMGIKVEEGRTFSEFDRRDEQPVAIVSRTFANRQWPGGGALGAEIVTGIENPDAKRTIVGVVADVQQYTLDQPATADLYVPFDQMPANQSGFVAARLNWVVAARPDAELDRLSPLVRAEIRAIDPEIATSSVRPMESLVRDSLAARRFNEQLVSLLGNASLLLVSIGIYGVAAFTVGQRRHEMTIRLALGATPRRLTRWVVAMEMKTVMVGVAIGVVVTAVSARAVAMLLFAGAAPGASSIVIAALTLTLVGGLACYAPLIPRRSFPQKWPI